MSFRAMSTKASMTSQNLSSGDGDGAGRRVGVLFVHGIGRQPPRDTLKRFGDPLYTWIDRWVKAVGAPTETCGFSERVYPQLTTPEEPHHCRATLSIPAEPRRERAGVAIEVVAAESCWANEFEVPSLPR